MQAALFLSERAARSVAWQAIKRRQADRFEVVPYRARNGDKSADFGWRVRLRTRSSVFYLPTSDDCHA